MGVNLKETLPPIRDSRGLTQNQLADLTGIKRTDINAIEKGRVDVGEDRLSRIARALEVSVVELDPARGEAAADSAFQTFRDRLEARDERLDEVLRRLRSIERFQGRALQRISDGFEALDRAIVDIGERLSALEPPSQNHRSG